MRIHGGQEHRPGAHVVGFNDAFLSFAPLPLVPCALRARGPHPALTHTHSLLTGAMRLVRVMQAAGRRRELLRRRANHVLRDNNNSGQAPCAGGPVLLSPLFLALGRRSPCVPRAPPLGAARSCIYDRDELRCSRTRGCAVGRLCLVPPSCVGTTPLCPVVACDAPASNALICSQRCGVHVFGANYSITLRTYDESEDLDVTSKTIETMVNHSDFVLGSYMSSLNERIAAYAQAQGRLMVTGGLGAEFVYQDRDLVFGTYPSETTYLVRLLEKFQLSNISRISYVFEEVDGADEFEELVCAQLDLLAPMYGIEVVSNYSVPADPAQGDLTEAVLALQV